MTMYAHSIYIVYTLYRFCITCCYVVAFVLLLCCCYVVVIVIICSIFSTKTATYKTILSHVSISILYLEHISIVYQYLLSISLSISCQYLYLYIVRAARLFLRIRHDHIRELYGWRRSRCFAATLKVISGSSQGLCQCGLSDGYLFVYKPP